MRCAKGSECSNASVTRSGSESRLIGSGLKRAERDAALAARAARFAELSKDAKSAEALGSGNLVRILNRNVNIGAHIRMEAGELWNVGDFWWNRLLNDGYAMSAL